jgi:hypothetical protein
MKSCCKLEENSLQRFKKVKKGYSYCLNSVLLVIDFCGTMSLLFTGGIMAIKSSAFGRTELSGKDAARFIKHMEEDKPSEWLVANLQKGRELLEGVNERRQELKNAK